MPVFARSCSRTLHIILAPSLCDYVQVAAVAQHHLAVRKTISAGGRIMTEIRPLLTVEEREHEVAAMLGMGLAEARSLMHASQHA